MKKFFKILGIGPIFVFGITFLSFLGYFFVKSGRLSSGQVQGYDILFNIGGMVFIFLGVFLWVYTVSFQKIITSISDDVLVTDGVYGWMRNPIYTAIGLFVTGLLLFLHNTWLFILPFIFWLYLTLLLKYTEEKWLEKTYGQTYLNYKKSVNRILPWPCKKGKKYKKHKIL